MIDLDRDLEMAIRFAWAAGHVSCELTTPGERETLVKLYAAALDGRTVEEVFGDAAVEAMPDE